MNKKRVIFLNGPMGAGKTTVGRLIQRSTPGCAFIDGDWCMDLEPFVGNGETRAMAADNILALFLLPLFGSLSDKCKETRLGPITAHIAGAW